VRKSFVLLLFSLVVSFFSKAQTATQQQDTIFTKVDVLPYFPGKEEGWKTYLKKHLKYPKKAWWDQVESEVTVEFVIQKDGTITDVRNLTISGEYGFEKEAVKVIEKSGKWIPAVKGGRNVAYLARLTIPFRLK
jgi:protein TonB